jgi:hypothetical protein
MSALFSASLARREKQKRKRTICLPLKHQQRGRPPTQGAIGPNQMGRLRAAIPTLFLDAACGGDGSLNQREKWVCPGHEPGLRAYACAFHKLSSALWPFLHDLAQTALNGRDGGGIKPLPP